MFAEGGRCCSVEFLTGVDETPYNCGVREYRLLLAAYALIAGASGCASEATQSKTTRTVSDTKNMRSSHADNREEAQRQMERLETQLALSEAENRVLRDRLSTKPYQRETVRIGGNSQEAEPDWVSGPQDGQARPFLRLHGPSVAEAVGSYDESETWELAERLPPLTVSQQKPEPVLTAIAAIEPSADPDVSSSAVQEYRAALALLQKRQFGSAVRAFERFAVSHPGHPYADNALYWKGEALYAQRQYQESIRAFEGLLKSYPRSGKRADALLKLGMSYERLGKLTSANRIYEQLIKNHPTSVAARRAPRRTR